MHSIFIDPFGQQTSHIFSCLGFTLTKTLGCYFHNTFLPRHAPTCPPRWSKLKCTIHEMDQKEFILIRLLSFNGLAIISCHMGAGMNVIHPWCVQVYGMWGCTFWLTYETQLQINLRWVQGGSQAYQIWGALNNM